MPEPQRDPRGRARCGGHATGRGGCSAGGDAGVGGARWRDRRTERGVGNARHSGCGVGAQAVLRSQAGNIFTLCMISGPSARKTALDGKIPAPCIQNHPIAPGNGHMGRRCCHFYPKKHAWGENVASKGAYCAHSAKRERIRRDSCQMGPRSAAMQGRGCEVLWGGAVGDAAGESNTAGSGADGMGMAGATGRRRDTGGHGGVGTRRWRDRRQSQAGTSSPGREPGGAGGHGGTGATVRGLTARRARLKRVTVGRERSGLTRRNTPTRVAAIRPNWQALPQRALRALR